MTGEVSERIHDPISFQKWQDWFEELQTVGLLGVTTNPLFGSKLKGKTKVWLKY